MSKVVITGNASGTGDFTIAAPNSNTDRTLTLPNETGTVAILGANTFTGAQTFSLFPTISALSYIFLNTANGYGSTNNKIRRFTNVVNNVGSDITYADSATLGGTFTVNTDGVYSVSFSDNFNAAGNLGLSLNSTQLTTGISGITAADRLSISTTPANQYTNVVSAVIYANAGDVIRAHNDGAASGATTPARSHFTIARVA